MRYDLSAFGKRLREERKRKGYTQERLADALYMERKTIRNWERGHNDPDLILLVCVCEVLDISIDSLFTKNPTESHKIPHSPMVK
jgi:transcriptional regulator with XRE-family HTH domain